jgi:prepilin-type N-terminal cleavage/methylation domain-containing protein
MRYTRGFTLIELVVVVIAIAILAGAVIERVLPLVARAQRIAFLQVQSDLRSALRLEAAERITRGESHTLGELAAVNPMTLLPAPPRNYVGTWPEDALGAVPGATWYFDERTGRLVYRVGGGARFEAVDGPPARIELAVELVYEDRDGDGAYHPARDRFGGLELVPVHAYRWPE